MKAVMQSSPEAAIQGWGGASVSPRLNGTGSKMLLRCLLFRFKIRC